LKERASRAFCLGCCWFLMALLFFGSVAGIALASWGVVVAIQAH